MSLLFFTHTAQAAEPLLSKELDRLLTEVQYNLLGDPGNDADRFQDECRLGYKDASREMLAKASKTPLFGALLYLIIESKMIHQWETVLLKSKLKKLKIK